MKFLKKLTKFNENIGTILSEGLSSMQMFYIVTFCVVCPLLVERPNSLILWIQYLSTAILQAVALPLLGFTTKKSGATQEKIIRESHKILLKEFNQLSETHELIINEINERTRITKEEMIMFEQVKQIYKHLIENNKI